MKRGSSLRLTLRPRPPISVTTRLPSLPCRRAHLLRGGLDRLDDVDIPGAATEVAGDRLTDLQLGRTRVARQQRDARHHHARRAEAALESVLLPEPFLDRVELPILLQSLHRLNLPPIRLNREDRTGLHRSSIEQDRAGATTG